MYIRLIKANKEDWKILRCHDYGMEDSRPYFYITGPNGIYRDDDGYAYRFDIYSDALEKLKYLRDKHSADEKKIKAYGIYDRWEILKQHVGGKEYYIISTPDGKFYKDDEGKEYHFKTRQDALEELEYLRGEHDEDKKKVESEQKDMTMVWTGTAEEADKLTSKYGLKYKLKEGEGDDPYLYIELFGNPTSIKNFVIEQGFGGDEEAAKYYVPGIFSL